MIANLNEYPARLKAVSMICESKLKETVEVKDG